MVIPIELRKYEPACIFFGSADDIIEFEGRTICGRCKEKIAAK